MEKKRLNIPGKVPLKVVGIVLLIILAASLLWTNRLNSNEAIPAQYSAARFEGEYRIGDGPWQDVVAGEHISATKGDVTFKGVFWLVSDKGEVLGKAEAGTMLAFFVDHINITFYEKGQEPYRDSQEDPVLADSSCGEAWTAYTLTNPGDEEIVFVVHNPHRFGNETAIDDMLNKLSVWAGIDFERDVLKEEAAQRNIAAFLFVAALSIFGIAMFSAVLRIKSSSAIGILGAVILFASGYFVFSSEAAFFWNPSVVTNTTMVGLCLILYMLALSEIIRQTLRRTKAAGAKVMLFLGIADAVIIALPIISSWKFYDLLSLWAVIQAVVNICLIGCIVKELSGAGIREKWMNIICLMPLVSFFVDGYATFAGIWQGGLISKYVFLLLFIIALVVVWRIIPQGFIDSTRAKELEAQRSVLEAEKSAIEAELKEKRVSIMLSQIQPHFIYNTLGTIERMCLKDSRKAFELVRNFSLYLRGNFGELDSVTPIPFEKEMEHVRYYVYIEQSRFPDMTVLYDLKVTEFVLPALSVQPLVENAIKHGLMQLESGGTVTISSYETETHFCVEVKDDGGGFDVHAPRDTKKHVGLANIQGRLKEIVDGVLLIESAPGKGTRAVIMIPKEGG